MAGQLNAQSIVLSSTYARMQEDYYRQQTILFSKDLHQAGKSPVIV